MPTVSIIVCTYKRPAALRECVESIEATMDLPYEIVAVSVEGDVETHEYLAPKVSTSFRHIVQQTRAGLVNAMNMGFRAATGDFQLQINDDCILLPYSISNAVRFMQAPAHASTVGQTAFFHNSPVKRNVHSQIQVEGEWYYVCHVRGLCYANFGLARRELYKRLDYFDPQYFMYGADPDFSLKVWHQAGLSVVPCPGAIIKHKELNDERGAFERSRQTEDNAKLFAKWHLNAAAQ
ncbi:MAG TPA: glycosyltransferase [Phycisphaerales bacterium]|nr:glycosyltransferase [Phycisphaerales bacterium]